QINGLLAPGFTTRQGMRALEEVFAQTMSRDMGFDYSGMSFQEQVASQGVPASAVIGFSVLVVFLLMAALYESWTLPFAVLLATPIAMFGALGALWLRRFELDVFSQIGMLMVIGLAAKNAILIVEFAKVAYEGGMSLVDAALEGVRVRRRALFMTSFAFILGCVPLWTAAGAGAVGRQVLGTVVIGGMLTDSLGDLGWWQLFKDPALHELITTAVVANRDLQVAVARVLDSRAQLGVARAAQFPQVNASGSYQYTRPFSKNSPMAQGAEIFTGDDWQAGMDLTFELDLWGRLRRGTAAARAELLASEETRRVVLMTLVADVARTHFDLLELDDELEIARRTLQTRQASLELQRRRFEQ